MAYLISVVIITDDGNMDFFDGSFGMWIQLTKYSAFAVAVAYGMYRRWYVRLWPLLTLGFILNITTQLIFTDHEMHGVGWLWGLVVYPIYIVVGGMAGVGLGAFVEWRWPHLITQGLDAPDKHLYAVMEEAAKRQAELDKVRLAEHDIPMADALHETSPENLHGKPALDELSDTSGPTPEQIYARLHAGQKSAEKASVPPAVPQTATNPNDVNTDRDAA